MESNKQKILIENLISNSDVFAICQSIIDSNYFDPQYRNTVQFINNYYNEYHNTPEPRVIEAETGVSLEKHDISPDQIHYTTSEIESFCKQQAITKAILSSPPLIEEGNYGAVEQKIRDAIMVSLHKDLGVRYYENVLERLQRMAQTNQSIPTNWKEVDELLFGGLGRKELALFAANSGGGKSITLSNLALNVAEQGYNVLYISLELDHDVVAQRFDTMHTGISRKYWQSHMNEIATKVEKEGEKNGVIDIILMKSGTTANDVRSYLKEYFLTYSFYPDLIIVDYLDKMNPNEKGVVDTWTKDKLCSEQIRDIGIDFNAAIASASQLNRDAVEATHHNHSHIAGGISKINECDVFITITLTEAMKACGEIVFSFLKTRNSDGVGSQSHLEWDNKFLRIRDPNNSLHFKSKKEFSENTENNSKGSDLMNMLKELDME